MIQYRRSVYAEPMLGGVNERRLEMYYRDVYTYAYARFDASWSICLQRTRHNVWTHHPAGLAPYARDMLTSDDGRSGRWRVVRHAIARRLDAQALAAFDNEVRRVLTPDGSQCVSSQMRPVSPQMRPASSRRSEDET